MTLGEAVTHFAPEPPFSVQFTASTAAAASDIASRAMASAASLGREKKGDLLTPLFWSVVHRCGSSCSDGVYIPTGCKSVWSLATDLAGVYWYKISDGQTWTIDLQR